MHREQGLRLGQSEGAVLQQPQSQSLTLISEGDVPESQEKSAIKALQFLLDPVWAFLNI